MNFLEKQVELSRTLFEINVSTLTDIMKAQQEDVRKYLELNNEFGQKLPTVTDVPAFVELQREYGEAVWKTFRTGSQAQVDIVKGAIEHAGEAVRSVFATEEGAEAA